MKYNKEQEKSFNSTLVQLKATNSIVFIRTFNSFNSTLVQLKAVTYRNISLTVIMFQFYLSSIKSTS